MIGIQIDGMDELNKVLREGMKQYPKEVLEGCADTGFLIEREAKINETRVDTGNLRSSIRTNVDKDREEVSVTAGGTSEGVKDVYYAVYQEFGTRHIEPLLFMTRAAEVGFRQLPELVAKRLNEVK